MSSLGIQLSEHRTRPEILRRASVVALAGAVLASGAFAFSAWRWYDALTRYGILVVWRLSAPWLAAGVFFAIIAAGALISSLQQRNRVVRIHERGISLEKGKTRNALEWGQIGRIQLHAVRYGISGLSWGHRSTLRLMSREGKVHRLSSTLADFASLVDAVKSRVYPLLLHEMRQAIQQGDPLDFGDLMLTSIGVHQGRRLLPWERLEGPDLSNGWLSLRGLESGRPSTLRVLASHVPNVELCAQLIEHLRRE